MTELEFRADLHCHSSFSDGTDTPPHLIELAIEKGLSGLSITDHDTTAAYPEALVSAKERDFPLLSGIEFSASYRAEPVHILGYAYHLQSAAIITLCERHKRRRQERNQEIVENLRKRGIILDLHTFQEKTKGSWGRPHIADALVKMGVVSSIQEAFDLFLAEGRPAYVPGEPISVEETIDSIHQGRGKAVLAHPHLIKRKSTLRALLKMPLDGLECYYARFTLEQAKKWIDLAQQRKWLMTGGSDYHGHTKPHNSLGSSWVGKETFDLLYTHFLAVN
jgi:3',5'-nucleoside bisphosphate phosphatase